MPRDGTGTYIAPEAAVVTGTPISSVSYNTSLADIGAALTGSVAADGQTPMTGPLTLAANPTLNLQAAPKQYVDTRVLKAGDTMTGPLVLPGDPTAALQAAPKQYVDTMLPLAGGTMTGSAIVSNGAPSFQLNKQASGQRARVLGLNNNLSRWGIEFGNATAESGSNVGSDLAFVRYADDGSSLGSAVTVARSTGAVTAAAGFVGPLTGNVTGAVTGAASSNVLKTGDTMTGDLTISKANAVLLVTATSGSAAVEIGGVDGAVLDLKSPSSDDFDLRFSTTGGGGSIQAAGNTAITFATDGVERARVAGTGQVRIATTSTVNASDEVFSVSGASGFKAQGAGAAAIRLGTADDNFLAAFYSNAGAVIGSITATGGGTGTSFNTTSDARLKDLAGGIEGSGALLDALEPKQFRWKSAPSGPVHHGFMAQDVQAAHPEAFALGIGEPGQPGFIPHGVDMSKLVPILWAEVRALRARVAALEAA